MPVEKISNIIPQVAFPAFSKLQLDVKAYAANFLKGMKLLNLLFIPSYIVIFILAEDIVDVLLGSKWSAIVTPMRILCLVMPLRAFEVLFIPAMNGLGKSNITMLTSGLSLIVMVCAFMIGINWGYIGLCWAWAVGFPIIYFVMIVICINYLNIKVSSLAHAYKAPLISSVCIFMIGIPILNNYQQGIQPLVKIIAYSTASIFLNLVTIYFVDRTLFTILRNVYRNGAMI